MNDNIIVEVYNILSGHYPGIFRSNTSYGRSWWPADDTAEMMTGAILTQNTNWGNVEKALQNFKGKLSPLFILSCTHEELAAIIRPSGFFNQKTERLKLLMQWFESYGFDSSIIEQKSTATLRNELLAIKGIGRETADSILVYGFGKTSFVIDAYTRRIFSRLGLDVPKDYDEFRNIFEASLEESILIYDHYHGFLVEHAKRFCKKKPECTECPLQGICTFAERSQQRNLCGNY